MEKEQKQYTYKIKENGINEIIDEKNNTVMMIREVAWGKNIEKEEYHLEIRKWYVNTESEMPGKGFTFTTEKSPHNLVNTMVKLGFGETKKIIDGIKDRPDFEDSLAKSISKNKINEAKNKKVEIDSDDYFVPKNLLL